MVSFLRAFGGDADGEPPILFLLLLDKASAKVLYRLRLGVEGMSFSDRSASPSSPSLESEDRTLDILTLSMRSERIEGRVDRR